MRRAEAVLAKLEAGREATGGLAAGLDDLPLFAATLAEAPAAARTRCARRSPVSTPMRWRRAPRSGALSAQADRDGGRMSDIFSDLPHRRAIIDRHACSPTGSMPSPPRRPTPAAPPARWSRC